MHQFGEWLAGILKPTARRNPSRLRRKSTRTRRRCIEPLERRLMLDAGPVSITEFLASNDSGLQDEDGQFSDWIEIYNGGTQAVDLAGWHLTDDSSDLDKWAFPSQPLDGGEYLVVFASGKDRLGTGPDGEHHTNFSLDASGEYLALVRDDGEIVSQFAPAFPEQRTDVSYGTGQQLVGQPLVNSGDQASVFVPTDDSLGLDWTGIAAQEPFDDSPAAGWIAATTGVGFDIDGGPVGDDEPFGQDAVNRASLDGWHGSTIFNTPFPNDGTGGSATISSWRFYCDNGAAVGRNITPLLVESVGGEYIVRGIGATRSVDASGLQSHAFDVQSGTDTFDRSSESFHMGVRFGSPTVSNAGVVEFDGGASSWAFYGQGGPLSSAYDIVIDRPVTGPQSFSSLGRDYSIQFLLGSSGLESLLGDGSAAIESAMHENNASAYVRTEFVVQDSTEIGSLLLRMQYDDGFVAYLNGAEVARRNTPDSPAFDSAARSDRSREAAAQFEEFDLTGHVDLLRDGTNVLGIHGLNHSADSSDFLIVPELLAVKASSNRYLSAPTPGQANVGGVIDFVADTTFSIDRGFFSEPFDVVVTTDTPGATIVYTTNGSSPTLDNGTRITAADSQSLPVATLHVAGTTTLRAAAFKDDYQPTNVDTQTYLFTADVVRQSVMSPAITNHAVWGSQLEDALLAVPTVSLVTSNAFLSSTVLKETETSIELIMPDGSPGFQLDAGIEHFGGHSLGYPKKSMRISFKKEYGEARLHYDLFGSDATDNFDQILLRSGSHDTVFYENGTKGIYVRNRWIFDRQQEMGQPAPHGRYVHVYINGTYWGQYHLMERPNAAFMASYFGGDKEDYDALNAGNPVDGDLAAWNAMTGSVNDYEQLQQYLDVVNYADYMLLQFYCGNDWDWNHAQNWMAARKQEPGAGFQFFSWDSDMVLRRGLYANVINRGGPGDLWGAISQHEEFRVLLADRAQRLFFNGGILTPQRVMQSLSETAQQINRSIIPETARWGEQFGYTPSTWAQQLSIVRGQIVANRTSVVVQQMRDAGVFPQIDAPSLSHPGGKIPEAFNLEISAPQGTIYYTLDGNDPRLAGGDLSNSAVRYTGGPIVLNETTVVKARVRLGNGWSALNEAQFLVTEPATSENLAITELNYHPHGPTPDELDGEVYVADDFEFIELQNTSNVLIDLAGVRFTDGIDFAFPDESVIRLEPGELVVVVKNVEAFEARYGTGIRVAGSYAETGTSLRNGGETVELADRFGQTILQFSYDDSGSWPGRTDGKGSSLEILNVTGDYGDSENWRSSAEYGGSPGNISEGPRGDVVVNEVLTHTDLPDVDTIELHNTTNEPIDIGGWYLSDGSSNYRKFQIPDGTLISAGGYLVFNERDFYPNGPWNPEATDPGEGEFALDGAHGDDVWLLETDGAGKLSRFVDHAEFGAARTGESFGRWSNSAGDVFLYPMITPTLGEPNSGPRLGEVIISEVMYFPPDPDPNVEGEDEYANYTDYEFVEIYNASGSAVDLTGWRLRKGLDFDFPAGTQLAYGATLLVVSFDLVDGDSLARFRSYYGIDQSVAIVGGHSDKLSNYGEKIQLQRPDEPPDGEPDFIPHLIEDEVVYQVNTPWPTSPFMAGDSLARLRVGSWGNDAAAWTGATPSPGLFEQADDAYEPNDTLATASLPAADWSDTPLSSIAGLGIQADTDWYRIDVPGNQRHLTVDVTFSHALGNIDVQVVDSSGLVHAASQTTTDNEQINAVLPHSGTWYLNVFGGNSGSVYDLVYNASYLHPGDADLSGATDLSDFNIWNANKFIAGTDWATGDFNGDGNTDLSDFNIWNAYKFTAAPSPDPAPPAAAAGELADAIAAIDDLAWLRESQRLLRSKQSSDASTLAACAVDRLLATYWE